jgi:hypothetical protein
MREARWASCGIGREDETTKNHGESSEQCVAYWDIWELASSLAILA